MRKISALVVVVALFPLLSIAFTGPDASLTPGVLCTTSDPNFQGLDYPEQVARCARNIKNDEKMRVAESYGHIPQSDWANYEFDHLIPLCAGGSNDIKNLWPQPIDEAHKKDVLEVEICTAMKAGNMKQADAVQKVHDWFASRANIESDDLDAVVSSRPEGGSY